MRSIPGRGRFFASLPRSPQRLPADEPCPRASRRRPHVLLITGAPGVGKTTVIRHVAHGLSAKELRGFYTEEIRQHGDRRGFRLKIFDGTRASSRTWPSRRSAAWASTASMSGARRCRAAAAARAEGCRLPGRRDRQDGVPLGSLGGGDSRPPLLRRSLRRVLGIARLFPHDGSRRNEYGLGRRFTRLRLRRRGEQRGDGQRDRSPSPTACGYSGAHLN